MRGGGRKYSEAMTGIYSDGGCGGDGVVVGWWEGMQLWVRAKQVVVAAVVMGSRAVEGGSTVKPSMRAE